MTVLDVFALIVLIVLVAAAVGTWIILGMLPGKIARQRNHPQAEAINVCGWWGVHNGCLAAVGFHMGVHESEGAPGHRQGCA